MSKLLQLTLLLLLNIAFPCRSQVFGEKHDIIFIVNKVQLLNNTSTIDLKNMLSEKFPQLDLYNLLDSKSTKITIFNKNRLNRSNLITVDLLIPDAENGYLEINDFISRYLKTKFYRGPFPVIKYVVDNVYPTGEEAVEKIVKLNKRDLKSFSIKYTPDTITIDIHTNTPKH